MMDDEIDSLLIEVRANTQGFAADIDAMRASVDGGLADGFAKAGNVLERGLLSAIRRGSLGFDDLGRVALRTMDQIAAQAMEAGIGHIFGRGGGSAGGAPGGGFGGLLGGIAGALLGLPGRATGGPVAPGSAYLVGERGPEVFVPTSAGRIEAQAGSGVRDVRVAIQLAPQRGADAPMALRRSARQVASTVRRALG